MVPPTVCIGIAVHVEPAQLTQTLRFLQTFTGPAAAMVLLPDGPDDETAEKLRTDLLLLSLPQYPTAGASGMAACFNRLAANTDADVVVLLESGVLVGPSWLERLLAALQRPACGLAGPSTNSSRNQQAITRHSRADEISIRRMSGEALRRFGTAVRSLEPLYNLGDFCYAVRREVIDAIGPADEGYGIEPGWEMDYNVRAARAGFRGVWVGAAYVHRSAPTERCRRDGDNNLDPGRRRYQDRFCGRRLRGESFPYETHCRGDDCEHFAPPDRIPAAISLDVPEIPPQSASCAARFAHDPRPAPPVKRLPVPLRRSEQPLVTAIMPTRNRPDLALQSVRYFLRQDYTNSELIIIESGEPQLASLLPDSPRIRHICEPKTRSIGAMRNLGCQNARGELIIQWDDDDWHGTKRISRQIAPMEDGEADVTALRDVTIFDVERWRFWKWSADLHRRMLVRDVHGGTLAFRRSIWERLARYPDRSLAEDAAFLDLAVQRGARLMPVDADGLFIYVRHGGNTWDLGLTADPMPTGWLSTAEPALPIGDRNYYVARSSAAAPPARGSVPLVSCVMPTYDRRAFIPAAVAYFCRQDYPAIELVVVDDGTEPIADLIPDDPRIRYHRIDGRMVLGAKRNLACELARGEIFMHWDDDDWYSPVRVSRQVEAMMARGSDLCGMGSLPYYDPAARRAWKYVWPSTGRFWAAGPTLAYRRHLWERSKFPEVATGEDSRFVWSREVRSPLDISDTATIIALIHERNTVPKAPHGPNWIPLEARDVEASLDADLRFYADALVGGQRACL